MHGKIRGFGWHIKRIWLQDRDDFHRFRARQIVLIFNSVLVLGTERVDMLCNRTYYLVSLRRLSTNAASIRDDICPDISAKIDCSVIATCAARALHQDHCRQTWTTETVYRLDEQQAVGQILPSLSCNHTDVFFKKPNFPLVTEYYIDTFS